MNLPILFINVTEWTGGKEKMLQVKLGAKDNRGQGQEPSRVEEIVRHWAEMKQMAKRNEVAGQAGMG